MIRHTIFDIFWHPVNNGIQWHLTKYALYISIFHLQINYIRKDRS